MMNVFCGLYGLHYTLHGVWCTRCSGCGMEVRVGVIGYTTSVSAVSVVATLDIASFGGGYP